MSISHLLFRAVCIAIFLFASVNMRAGGPTHMFGLNAVMFQGIGAQDDYLTYHYYYDHRSHFGIGAEYHLQPADSRIGFTVRGVLTQWQYLYITQRDPRYPNPTTYPYEVYTEHYIKTNILLVTPYVAISGKGEKHWLFVELGPNVELLLGGHSRNFRGTQTGPTSTSYDQIEDTKYKSARNRIGIGTRFGFTLFIAGNIYASLVVGLENFGLQLKSTSMGPSPSIGLSVHYGLAGK